MIFLSGLTLAALAMRLAGLGQEALWSDEFYTLQEATQPGMAALIRSAFTSEPHPPGYFLIIRATIALLGSGDVALRLPSALAGAVTPLVYFFFLRRLFPAEPRIARWGAILFALSPFHLWYSQEARSYAIVLLIQTLMLLALVKALAPAHDQATADPASASKTAARNLALAAALAILNLALHFYTILLAAVLLGLVVVRIWQPGALSPNESRPDHPASRALLAAAVCLGAAILFSAAGIINFLLRGEVLDWFPRRYGIDLIANVLRAQWLGPMWSPFPGYLQRTGIAAGTIVALAGAWALWRDRRANPRAAALIGTFLLMIFLLPVAVSFVRPVVWWGQRFLVLAIPFTIALLAIAATRRRAVMALLIIVMAMQVYWVAGNYRFRQKRPWDSVAADVQQRGTPGAPVHVVPARLAGLFERYVTDGRPVQGFDLRAGLPLAPPAPGEELWVVGLTDIKPAMRAAWGGFRVRLSTGEYETHAPDVKLWAIRAQGLPPEESP